MKRTAFFVCKKCGSIMQSDGVGKGYCCGEILEPMKAKETDDCHKISITCVENDYFITLDHPMTKEHFIKLIAFVSFDRTLVIKLYPEQNAEVRFPQMRCGKLLVYCNKDGLFEYKI